MVIALVTGATKWINTSPPTNGVSNTMSPAMIVQGLPKLNLRYNRIVYGSYALVYMGTKNDMKARSIPAIALNLSNGHGGIILCPYIVDRDYTVINGHSYQ